MTYLSLSSDNPSMTFQIMIFFVYLGLTLCLFSPTWPWVWLGMELNSYAFLANFKYHKEFSFKYFFIQAISSVAFVMSFLINDPMIFFTSMMMKLGVAPFFFWIYPSVKWLDATSLKLFFCVQKLIPLFLVMNMEYKGSLYCMAIFFFFFNSMVSIWGVWVKSALLDILIFSSIYQFSWIMLCMLMEKLLLSLYFLSYLIIVYFVIVMKGNNNYSNKLNNFICWCLIFFMLGGLPPSLIFFFKIKVIMNWVTLAGILVVLVNLMTTVIFVYSYLKIVTLSIQSKKSYTYLASLSLNLIGLVLIMLSFIFIF